MAKKSMDDLLKRRMSAAQQASELEVGNEAYETMFQAKADAAVPRFCELPINSLCPFRTADIGFHNLVTSTKYSNAVSKVNSLFSS